MRPVDISKFLSDLTGDQALEVLGRLAVDDASMARKIETEAKRVLATVDSDDVADEVFTGLDMIAVEDCWDRAGSHRDGYTSPEDAAADLIEEELQPFVDQATRYHDLGMPEQEQDYCAGIILGLYRYDKESKSEFKDWCADIPGYSADCLLQEWRKRNPDVTARENMDALIRARCPQWANR